MAFLKHSVYISRNASDSESGNGETLLPVRALQSSVLTRVTLLKFVLFFRPKNVGKCVLRIFGAL